MKYLLIQFQLDKSLIPLHIHARTVAIHHILNQSVQQKILNVSNVGIKCIFQKFVAPKPQTNKHLLPCFTLLDGPSSPMFTIRRYNRTINLALASTGSFNQI